MISNYTALNIIQSGGGIENLSHFLLFCLYFLTNAFIILFFIGNGIQKDGYKMKQFFWFSLSIIYIYFMFFVLMMKLFRTY